MGTVLLGKCPLGKCPTWEVASLKSGILGKLGNIPWENTTWEVALGKKPNTKRQSI